MEFDDENFFDDDGETLDNLSETLNLNDTKSVNTSRILHSRYSGRKSNSNRNVEDTKLENASANFNTKSNWRINNRGSVNSNFLRSGYNATSSRTWKLEDRQKDEADRSDNNEDREDISEAMKNLFLDDTIDSINTKSKINSTQSSWRRNGNDQNQETASKNSKLGTNWRSRNIDDSSEALDSWRTKYNGDKSSKWNNGERQKIATGRSDNNEDGWRNKRTVLRNYNKDETLDDRSPLRNRNKSYDNNQNRKPYRVHERTRQNISGRNRFENINLSLQEILKLETEEVPEKVIIALVDKLESFKEIVGGYLSFEDVVLLLRVFDKICSSHFDENRGKLIISIVNGKFLDKISQYLLLLAAQDPEDKNENMFFWDNPEQFWNNLLILYENIFEFMPATAADVLPKIIKATVVSINDAEEYQEIKLSTDVKEKLEKFQEIVTKYNEKQNQTNPSSEIEDPPDSFRLLNVYPTIKEITTNEVPFIRPIIKNGAYQSVEHYLDVQFRLLKEDFTASLRNGICTYLQKGENQKPEQQFDVRIYENVKFISPHIARDRVASLLQYTTKIDKKGIEESSKRFIYGSLLCFTSNNFEDVSFGSIVDSDLKFLRKGQIIVDIREGYIDYNKNYTMIECTVFFEPYYQVLMALKKIHEDNFPFKDYIIDVTPNIKPPKYIKATTEAYFMEDRYKIKILSPETWPKPEQVELNESQFKAFQSALTQEFCIIQGPPGTGKTYTTLRIVEFLLKNKISLGYTGPIFVICFTNHALDQFLEGLLKYTEYLLRVGGQSKSPVMQNYNLNHYRDIIRTIVRRAKIPWDEYDCDSDDYHPDEAKYNFSDYMRHYYTRNEAGRLYFDNKRKVQTYQKILTDVLSFNGIIRLQTLYKYGVINRFSLFGAMSCRQIIEWLMENDKQYDIEEITKEEENKSDNTEFYFQHNELYNERNLVDDLIDETHFESPTEVDDRFEITPKYYENRIKSYENEIRMLDVNDEQQGKIFLRYNAQIKSCSEQMRYLSWRLRECKLQNEVDETPDMTVRPCQMKSDDRWKLYRHWLHLLRLRLCDKISNMDQDLRSSHQAYQEIAQLRDIYIMKKMHVIGMTTTGAARHQKLLQTLKCPIVIAEEAAEVLEAHIVVSLTEHCQHLILIGDHQQLRPNTAQYNLATKYNLDISLFERMVQNGIHCQQLNIQHRMRPEIAKLIVPAIYPKVENSPKVEKFAPILGVTKNMFFINHSVYEDYVANSSSHKNVYEAKYLIRLASYLVKQGYKQEDITILATYKGQMYLLIEEKSGRDELEGVRITVVDNFQGEENKIILLSLVRSNKEANIGFLKTENRVCVALSRAKEGFFIIGNMNNLEHSSKIWPKIKKALVDQDAIDETLTLQCQIHKTKTTIRSWKDFAQIPEGGCNIPCNTKLNCDHVCKLACHPYDAQHEMYICKENCTRTCPRGHPCRRLCYSKCVPCIILIKTKLECGHIQSIPCSVEPKNYQCKKTVDATFYCGHTGQKRCYENLNVVKCLHPCEKLLDCGHTYKFACHVKYTIEFVEYKCEEPCSKFKKGCSTNEHICPLKCCEECPPCTDFIQKRRSTCTHKVRVPCNEEIDDGPCREKCRKMLSCGHYCPKLCFEECGNCPVMVTKTIESCGHSIKTQCRNEVDRTMCTDQCSQLLKCGHPCKNKCNEPCSEQCKVFVTYNDPTTEHLLTKYCYMQTKILESEQENGSID